jgi:hypothetical protein
MDGGPAGLETLLLLTRRTPLPAGVDLEGRLRGLGPQTGLAPAEAVWFRDWETVRDEPGRGPLLNNPPGSSHPAERAQQELKRRLGDLFGFTRAVCFGNEGGKK